MTPSELEAHYRRYLTYLNTNRARELQDFVADTVTHNGKTLTREQYQDFVAGNFKCFSTIDIAPELIVANDDQVACRIKFSNCKLEKELFGCQPTGRVFDMVEHVFYRFQEGKIVEVQSLVDEIALREQR
ncbi:putativelike polyketide cyclase [Phaeomoniella chlamydospora]|uniref:Putativelike polyketide cyclase n=1 Tax=Phaeomoniella chlamydospora TaxID=158046 RepID=A0A0G2DVD8_PHACM|nr:putativelike polyketide cyclase [Phaeomoniella chlamydospora]